MLLSMESLRERLPGDELAEVVIRYFVLIKSISIFGSFSFYSYTSGSLDLKEVLGLMMT